MNRPCIFHTGCSRSRLKGRGMRMYYGGGLGAHLLDSFFLLGLVRLVELLLELVDLPTLFHTGGGEGEHSRMRLNAERARAANNECFKGQGGLQEWMGNGHTFVVWKYLASDIPGKPPASPDVSKFPPESRSRRARLNQITVSFNHRSEPDDELCPDHRKCLTLRVSRSGG
jgi:hypothetical protein